MEILYLLHAEVARHEDVVEPVSALPPRPLPAQLAPLIPVALAERVADPVGLEASQDGELSLVPALPPVGSQPAPLVAGEGPHLPARVLLAWRVEVPADDPRMGGCVCEVAVDRLVRADLREIRLRADRRVEVDDLRSAGAAHREHPLRPRDVGDRDPRQRLPARREDRERPRP